MPAIPGTVVAAKITSGDTANNYPTHDANEGKGGIHHVANEAARDAIASDRKYAGMFAYLISEARYDQWDGSQWVEDVLTLEAGGPAPSDASISGMIEEPEDKTYVVELKAPVACTIVELAAKTASGSCSAKVQIDGVDVTGTSISVDSTEDTGTASANNSVDAGDTIQLVISSSSSPVDLAFTIKAASP